MKLAGTRSSIFRPLMFEELGTPSHAEVLDVARRTAERVDRLLRKSGRSLEREGTSPCQSSFPTSRGLPPAMPPQRRVSA